MKEIVKDLTLLETPCEPLKFMDYSGTDVEEEKKKGQEIIAEIKEVMEADKNIVALAAPQIGYNYRIFCIRFNEVVKTFINPIVTKKDGSVIGPETFVGLDGKEILIARPKEITVVYYNDEFKYEDNKLLDTAARVFDQMMQLLDGVLPTELGLVSDIEQDGRLSDLSEEEVKEVTEFYKKYVAAKTKALTEAIKDDEEAAKEYNKLKFSEGVINGRNQIVENKPQMNRASRRKMDKLSKQMATKKFIEGKK